MAASEQTHQSLPDLQFFSDNYAIDLFGDLMHFGKHRFPQIKIYITV